MGIVAIGLEGRCDVPMFVAGLLFRAGKRFRDVGIALGDVWSLLRLMGSDLVIAFDNWFLGLGVRFWSSNVI